MSDWSKTDISQALGRTGAITVWIYRLCLVAAVAIAAPPGGRADDRPSFEELLTRAQAQAASGHRWSPPGDNMTETISLMMDLISTATPKQLADLSALLENDSSRGPRPPPQAPVTRPVTTEDASAPEPVAAEPPPAIGLEPVAPKPPPAIVLEPATPKPPPAIALEPVTPKPPPPIALEPVAPKPPPAIVSEPVAPKPARAPVAVHPGPRAADLFARGQDAERQGDVSGARRFYAVAADQGSATAARSLGRLYDPGYLKQTALGGIDPDPALARYWYERAVAMGDAQAAPLLQALAAR